VERDAIAGEQEALLVALKGKNEDIGRASAELVLMREAQQRRQTERHRILTFDAISSARESECRI
jgi:hypothetical protein